VTVERGSVSSLCAPEGLVNLFGQRDAAADEGVQWPGNAAFLVQGHTSSAAGSIPQGHTIFETAEHCEDAERAGSCAPDRRTRGPSREALSERDRLRAAAGADRGWH
jgi:hypothetical protein